MLSVENSVFVFIKPRMNQAEGSLIRLCRSNAVVYTPCHKSHQLNNNNDTNNNNNNKNKTIKSAQLH